MKKEVLLIILVFFGIVIISFNPQLTGSVVSEMDSEEIYVGELLAGKISKQSLELSYVGQDVIKQEIYVSGEVEDWVVISEDSFYAIPGEDKELEYYINVPEGTAPGDYQTMLAIITVDSFEDNSILNDHITQYITLNIKVVEEIYEGEEISNFKVFDTEDFPYFSFDISNLGNNGMTEDFFIVIYDSSEKKVLTEEFDVNVYAYQDIEVKRKIDDRLSPGRYYAMLNDEYLSTFDVVETIKKEGRIVYSTVEVDGNNAKVIAYFENTGEGILNVNMEGVLAENFFTTEVKIYPGDIYVFESEQELNNEDESYNLNLQIVSDSFVLAEVEENIYKNNAVALEVNFYIVFLLVVGLLILSHYLLVGRKRK